MEGGVCVAMTVVDDVVWVVFDSGGVEGWSDALDEVGVILLVGAEGVSGGISLMRGRGLVGVEVSGGRSLRFREDGRVRVQMSRLLGVFIFLHGWFVSVTFTLTGGLPRCFLRVIGEFLGVPLIGFFPLAFLAFGGLYTL